MTQLKAGEIQRYLKAPDFSKAVHLVYGPDRGLVSERSMKLAAATGIDLSDPFSAIKIDADSLGNDPDRLMNEAYTVSMFGGARLVWLRGVANNVSLAKQLERLLDQPPENTICLFEAGDLRKGTKIRDQVERAKNAVAIPCYTDNTRDITALLDNTLTSNGQTIGLEARHLLLSLLGGDRAASRAELDKLTLYCWGKNEITADDVNNALGDVSAISIDAITDAVITGNIAAFDKSVTKFSASGASKFQLFAAIIRQFQSLDKMRAEMEKSGKSANQMIAAARPPIFFARKAAVENALNKWSSKAIRAAHQRLQTALLDSRKNNRLDDDIAHMALLALTVQASRRS